MKQIIAIMEGSEIDSSRSDIADIVVSTLAQLPSGKTHNILFPLHDIKFWTENIHSALMSAMKKRLTFHFYIADVVRVYKDDCLCFGITIEKYTKADDSRKHVV